MPRRSTGTRQIRTWSSDDDVRFWRVSSSRRRQDHSATDDACSVSVSGGLSLLNTILYTIAPCSLGHLLLAAGDRGICHLRLGDDPRQLEERFRLVLPQARLAPASDRIHAWCDALVHYIDDLDGASEPPKLPLALQGTAFQRRVWSALSAIPCGEVRSYREIAEQVDVPRGARAVANACANNPVAVLVPCHRVVPSAGGTGGYRWAQWRKRRLLAREGVRLNRDASSSSGQAVPSWDEKSDVESGTSIRTRRRPRDRTEAHLDPTAPSLTSAARPFTDPNSPVVVRGTTGG